MNKLYKFSSYIVASLFAFAMVVGCTEDVSDKLSGDPLADQSIDVSSRISGLSSPITGAGSILTINGSGLSGVVKVRIGNAAGTITEVTDAAVTVVVSGFVTVGVKDVMLIWAGAERARISIEVVPNPVLDYFTPRTAGDGDEVIVKGNNLSYITSISIGGVAATINSQDDEFLSFTMPSGVSSAVIDGSTVDGSVFSTVESIVTCSEDPIRCLPVINTNGSFEEGELGADATVPGWGFPNTFNTYEVTDEEAHDGFQSAKITVTGISTDAWRIQPNTNMPIDPTKTYHLSFWVKGAGFTGGIKFAIDGGGSPGYEEYGGSETIEITSNEWQEISYDFSPAGEAAEGGDNVARFAPSMSYEGNLGGVIYFDNLRVTEVQ